MTEYFQHRSVDKLYLNSRAFALDFFAQCSYFTRPAEWYAQQDPDRFTFHVGETVVSIDTEARTVFTDKDQIIKYDYCVLATGSEATLPNCADLNVPGVFVYRNISDMNKLLAYAEAESVKGGNVSPFLACAARCLLTSP